MRRVHHVAGAALVLAVFSVTVADAASSPFPATLTMQRGLTESAAGHALPWGTTLTAAQARWVTLRSTGQTILWGVWKENGGPATFPVRSTDGGALWTAAGPQLATDWVGGSIYYVSAVLSDSSSAVVMVGNAVIDVTTDSGHQWYQYVNTADNWSITTHVVTGGGIGLRIGPASYSTLPKASNAIYVLDVAHHEWHRTGQSLRYGGTLRPAIVVQAQVLQGVSRRAGQISRFVESEVERTRLQRLGPLWAVAYVRAAPRGLSISRALDLHKDPKIESTTNLLPD